MGPVVAPHKRPLRTPARLRLKVELAWIKPVIWRRIVVPESVTLGKLRQVIQAATDGIATCTSSRSVASDMAFPIRTSTRVGR